MKISRILKIRKFFPNFGSFPSFFSADPILVEGNIRFATFEFFPIRKYLICCKFYIKLRRLDSDPCFSKSRTVSGSVETDTQTVVGLYTRFSHYQSLHRSYRQLVLVFKIKIGAVVGIKA